MREAIACRQYTQGRLAACDDGRHNRRPHEPDPGRRPGGRPPSRQPHSSHAGHRVPVVRRRRRPPRVLQVRESTADGRLQDPRRAEQAAGADGGRARAGRRGVFLGQSRPGRGAGGSDGGHDGGRLHAEGRAGAQAGGHAQLRRRGRLLRPDDRRPRAARARDRRAHRPRAGAALRRPRHHGRAGDGGTGAARGRALARRAADAGRRRRAHGRLLDGDPRALPGRAGLRRRDRQRQRHLPVTAPGRAGDDPSAAHDRGRHPGHDAGRADVSDPQA